MSYFFYDDNEPRRSSGGFNPESVDAIKQWLKHYENSLHLIFFAKNDTSRGAKTQALAELAICEKKMKYWERQPNWNNTIAMNGAIELKAKWGKIL
jgi:hypothetical protein